MLDRELLRIYALTDGDDVLARAEAALGAGVRAIQLRAKQASARDAFALALALRARCEAHGALCIVNDRLDLALAARAHGVHLGPEDLPLEAARTLAPRPFILGASAGDLARARACQDAGADYLGVGAIFEARPSKPDASAPRGLEALRVIASAVDLPVVAIGGVQLGDVGACLDAGAAGVALIRGIFGAADVAAAAAAFVEAARRREARC